MSDYRIEKDSLGEVRVPAGAYYAAQTQRALDNFAVSGLKPYPAFIWSMVAIKRAAAEVNRDLGLLDGKVADAIIQAADEALTGKWDAEFVVDPFQAGAGTSHNMNTNEVLANRANEILGHPLVTDQKKPVNPNDHVNMAQSTNDTIPTALRLGVLWRLDELLATLQACADAFRKKAAEWDDFLTEPNGHGILKMRAAGLHDGRELARLGLERRGEVVEGGDEVADDARRGGDVHRGGEHVVGGLRGVDVVVGVHVGAEALRGERRDDLVGVHVGARARAGLEHVDGEVLVVGARGDLVGGGHDRVGHVLGEHPELGVGARGGLLHAREGLDVPALEAGAGDREVLHGALRLRPVQRGRGDAHLAHRVVLDPELCALGAHGPILALRWRSGRAIRRV